LGAHFPSSLPIVAARAPATETRRRNQSEVRRHRQGRRN
jgi:hypothetical protein